MCYKYISTWVVILEHVILAWQLKSPLCVQGPRLNVCVWLETARAVTCASLSPCERCRTVFGYPTVSWPPTPPRCWQQMHRPLACSRSSTPCCLSGSSASASTPMLVSQTFSFFQFYVNDFMCLLFLFLSYFYLFCAFAFYLYVWNVLYKIYLPCFALRFMPRPITIMTNEYCSK